jgi:hypothetical protein
MSLEMKMTRLPLSDSVFAQQMMRLSGRVRRQARTDSLILFKHNPDAPAGLLDRDTMRQIPLLAQLIEMADNRARVSPQVRPSRF